MFKINLNRKNDVWHTFVYSDTIIASIHSILIILKNFMVILNSRILYKISLLTELYAFLKV